MPNPAYPALTIEALRSAVHNSAAAFRLVTKLQPIGHESDKVHPPTYTADERADKYAKEMRIVNGSPVSTILLNSVQAEANDAEEALQQAYDDGKLDMPMVQVNFPEEFSDISRITALEAPHRLADAILRDSCVAGTSTLWRDSELGKSFERSTAKDATAVLKLCPAALILGMWDSTGESGGSGTKFARAYVSEIVGFEVPGLGVKTASRIDPLGIEKAGIKILAHPTEGWTLDETAASKDANGAPINFGGKGEAGKPSAINHGNIPPSIDATAGGVSIAYALQTAVLSLTRIRMLRFGSASPEATLAARVYLASLGIAAIACRREQGWWLRSRCELIPTADAIQPLQKVNTDGSTEEFAVPTAAQACALVNAAAEEARKLKLLPEKEESTVRLVPAEKLLQLLRASRSMSAVEPESAKPAKSSKSAKNIKG